MRKIHFVIVLPFLLLTSVGASANNISVNNVSLTGQNSTSDYTMVQFDISWENSWRIGTDAANWDAAWVFVKYRVGSGAWQHAFLNENGHTTGSGTNAQINVGLKTPGTGFGVTSNPGLGVFVYRSATGSGTFSITGAKLRWNYGANGVADNAGVEIKVFAIEMVYVPQGNFKVGSQNHPTLGFPSFSDGAFSSGNAIPFLVTSEPIQIGAASGKLYTTLNSSGSIIGPDATLSSNFPTGYSAFYCMKYELSQGMYRDFLNTLSYGQQAQRVKINLQTDLGKYALNEQTTVLRRNGIRYIQQGSTSIPAIFACDITPSSSPYPSQQVNQSDDGESIPCNYLFWNDALAFLDWSGLRPMTELEYEKACRGSAEPVASQYAWGTGSVTPNQFSLIFLNENLPNESIDNNKYIIGTTTGNTGKVSGKDGPLRSGIFAGHSLNNLPYTATRAQSGASFYGIMELTGNLDEYTVNVSTTAGRSYTGVHGDGQLDSQGGPNESNWPPNSSPYGFGLRGGNYGGLFHVSNRTNATLTTANTRMPEHGCRGVRTE